jgi:hypothetical protein
MTRAGNFKVLAVLLVAAVISAVASALITTARPARAAFRGTPNAIAFISARDGDREIWRMRADGSRPVNLTNNDTFTDANPSWQSIP